MRILASELFLGAGFSDVGDAWVRLGCATSEKRPGTKSRMMKGSPYGDLRLVRAFVATHVQGAEGS
jgi:hypothetical protein